MRLNIRYLQVVLLLLEKSPDQRMVVVGSFLLHKNSITLTFGAWSIDQSDLRYLGQMTKRGCEQD